MRMHDISGQTNLPANLLVSYDRDMTTLDKGFFISGNLLGCCLEGACCCDPDDRKRVSFVAMTLYEFNRLSKADQLCAVWEQSYFVVARQQGPYLLNLYAIDRFFVEICSTS